jgi:DNA polymerase-3 subunit chi
MEISFYHLTATPWERALPALVQKAHGAGFRVLIIARDEEQAKQVDSLLWSFDERSFLPHSMTKDEFEAEQPIFITTESADNPNNADLLLLLNGSLPDASAPFKRVLDMFDGSNDEEVAAARSRWKSYKERGLTPSYFQQTPSGGWEKKA